MLATHLDQMLETELRFQRIEAIERKLEDRNLDPLEELARLVISGDLRWEGPIIVTGSYVGIHFAGVTPNADWVYGGVIVNEAVPTARPTSDAGNTRIFYSCPALNNALNKRALIRMRSWREL